MADKTISLKRRGNAFIEEYNAATATIVPGMRVQLTSDDEVTDVLTDKALTPAWHALEDIHQGKDIDEVYASGSLVRVDKAAPGERINGIVLDGETIVIGDFLQQTTAGKYVKVTDGVALMMARAAVSPSGSDARCEMEVL
ncbi:hypothetical protein KAR91_14350 [Candidatus Pacearchaeota archaeon]|nr:hypothetical protein [Candidatus Pacearchaeota archaeon]